MAEDNRFMAERKAKLEQWKALGHDGYAKAFDRSHTAEEAKEEVKSKKEELREAPEILSSPIANRQSSISMAGRIIAARDMGKLAFLKIRDVSGDFQICLAADLLGDEFKPWLKALDLGDYAGFSGEFFLTKHGEPTLMAVEVTPLSKALRPLPEKWHGLSDKEACYRERNLDLISNQDTFERFKVRSAVVKEVRNFYENFLFLHAI